MNILSTVLSIIGCITGISSLLINFYRVLIERTKLYVEFELSHCLYFDKLDNYSDYNTEFQGFIYIRLINRSSNPITIYKIQTYYENKEIFHHKYKESKIILKQKAPKRTNEFTYDMNKQAILPLKIGGFDVFQGYIFYDFLKNFHHENKQLDIVIKSTRKTIKKSCLINKFKAQINTEANQ